MLKRDKEDHMLENLQLFQRFVRLQPIPRHINVTWKEAVRMFAYRIERSLSQIRAMVITPKPTLLCRFTTPLAPTQTPRSAFT